jgi:hypothetical protein
MTRERFIYHLRRSQYRRDFGTQYKGPTFADRLLALLISILPKIGPLKSLDVKMPTQGTENLYMQSVIDSRDQYLNDLRHAAANTLTLDNRDFDTGLETKAGEYALTDETYAELLARLAHHKFAELTPPLQSNILSFYRNAQPPAFAAKNKRRWKETLGYIAQLQTLAPQTNAAAGTQ